MMGSSVHHFGTHVLLSQQTLLSNVLSQTVSSESGLGANGSRKGRLWKQMLTPRYTITHKKITEPNFIIFELFSVIPAL